MKRIFLYLRFMCIAAVISSFFGAALQFVIGSVKTYKAYASYFQIADHTDAYASMAPVDLATKYLVHSVDNFLFGLVLLIFAYGTYSLFIGGKFAEELQSVKWLQIKSIGHLKNILAEVIVIILFVRFLEVILLNIDKLRFELLVLPLSILALALSLKVLHLRHDGDSK